MPEVSTFKDLSVTFKKHPVTDDLVTVKDKAAVAQSIKGLLLTRRGERPFQPDLGSGLQDLLFEPLADLNTISVSVLNPAPLFTNVKLLGLAIPTTGVIVSL